MTSRRWPLVGLTCLSVLLAGCGRNESDAEAGHAHSEQADDGEPGERAGVSFVAGRGLQLSPGIVKALDLKTAEVSIRTLSFGLSLTAQVFATKPRVLANVRLPVDQADALQKTVWKGPALLRVDRSTANATHLVDLVFAFDTDSAHAVGDFIPLLLEGEPMTVLAVPRSAILDSPTGTFVYAVNGDAYLRTPVKTGGRSADFIEITDGLHVGEVVVVSPVEHLWLAELRITKGGGHSH
jgi:multidrug efflux pump subunit AcrA (membrane-fusion protein)